VRNYEMQFSVMSRFGVECRATRALSGIMIKAGLYSEKLQNAIFIHVQVWGVMPFYSAIYMA